MEFKERELGNLIFEIIDYRGKTPKKLGGDWSEKGIRALSAKNIKTGRIVQKDTIRFVDDALYLKWMKKEIEKGTIIITSEAPFGEVYYWNSDEKIVLSQRLFGIKIKKKYDSMYIYQYMTSSFFKEELIKRATGSTVTGLRQPQLLKCKIMLPAFENQKKIAKILSKIDEKIELNGEINDNLLDVGLTLFDKYNKEVSEYILLNQIIKFIKGKRPNDISSVEKKSYLKYLTIAGLNGQELNYADPDKMVIANQELLMVMDGASSGDIYYCDYGIVGSTIAKVEVIHDGFTNAYIYFSLKKYNSLIREKNTGSAIPHTDKVFVGSLEVPVIDKEKQVVFNCLIKKIQENERENEKLIKLRDTLLPKLMNGEIDLDNIEI